MLETIIAHKEKEIKNLEMPKDQQLEQRSFYEELKHHPNLVALIAEIKKASPSKGVIREVFKPIEIAGMYEEAGASAISILTDEKFFQGHRDYLTEVKKHVSLPILRKDFIIHEDQIEESYRIGADAILLIGEALKPKRLHDLYLAAKEKNLDVLVEVHSAEVLKAVLDEFTPDIVGVNNRDLSTFTTTIQQTEDMARFIPKECLFVSESGLFTREDIIRVRNAGANAVLIGEALMREDQPTNQIRHMIGSDSHAEHR